MKLIYHCRSAWLVHVIFTPRVSSRTVFPLGRFGDAKSGGERIQLSICTA